MNKAEFEEYLKAKIRNQLYIKNLIIIDCGIFHCSNSVYINGQNRIDDWNMEF